MAIHTHEQSAFVESRRVRMSHDGWIEQVIPDLAHLGLQPTPIKTQRLQYGRHYIRSWFRSGSMGDFDRREVNTPPGGNHTPPGLVGGGDWLRGFRAGKFGPAGGRLASAWL